MIALVGAPNAGKSTLFNGLTGAKVQMGNWPGTTVEVGRGAWKTQGATYDVIDFPGAYSLDPISPDEELTRKLVIDCEPEERPDLVLVAVDAAAISRSLYMVAQLAEHPFRTVIVLTKSDVAATAGQPVDAAELSRALGIPVVAVDPRRRSNLEQVGEAVAQAMLREPVQLREVGTTEADMDIDPDVDLALNTEDDFAAADARFAWIEQAVAASTRSNNRSADATTTERIDRVALHPVVGPVLFLAVMWLVFQITTTVAAPLQAALEGFFTGPLSEWTAGLLDRFGLTHPFFTGFIIDGLIGGVGMVLSFAPLMALMFLCLAVLEDSGYMSRAAVVTDRVMKAIGLPGKAFIPLIVGFGCNVPAISATRVLSKPQHRIQTALLVPLTSCSARLTLYVMLASVFFPDHAGTVVFIMYVVSIVLVVLLGMALRAALWRKMGTEALIIDLPTYQIPGARLALSVMWVRLKGFLETAGKIIVATVALIFILQATPVSTDQGFASEDLAPRDSAYGVISTAIAPIFHPAGFGSWSLAGPVLTGFVAKEAVISTWAQTYSVDDVTDASAKEQGESALATQVRADFDQASGGHTIAAVWAFMLFMLAYTPCVATIAAQRREIGWKWTLFGVAVQLLMAWGIAVAAFNLLKVWF
ncbi:ferrous iron transport protein B [Corynebacterium ulceribovis]|uniref:ferrous iron transport protein B n=1 Tax=Corynebacterium ulceribovis TaxID=487732 RepID=UPI00036B81C8|nr:ferrous iron transport protein B [Corynebacterium ulceribovis]